MELNDYQKKAMSTCLPSSENFTYMLLNLMAEVGEFSGKVAKAVRKKQVYVGDTTHEGGTSHINFAPLANDPKTREELDVALFKEAGDIMWQVAGLCYVMGWELEDVCSANLCKLMERKKAGTINGSGDGISGEERKAE